MLVFSKTSFQAPRIGPRNPRVLDFNDYAAVGFVPQGNVLEVAALDPQQGMIFYTLDTAQTAKPQFGRPEMDCIKCHMLSPTLNVSGLVIESVFPMPDGTPRSFSDSIVVDSRTPLDQRWGGYYVTGTTGDLRHRGNAVVRSGMKRYPLLAKCEEPVWHCRHNSVPGADQRYRRVDDPRTSDPHDQSADPGGMGDSGCRAGREAGGIQKAAAKRGGRSSGGIYAVQRRGGNERSGGGRFHVHQDVPWSAVLATPKDAPCAISICKSACSGIRSAI